MNNMSLIDAILSRRSIRIYEKKKVPEDVMNLILESGRQAPSAANRQPWHFIVLTENDLKEKLSYRGMNTFIKDSAFTVVGCAYVGDTMGRRWSTIDTSIALQNMVIAAWALGVGSCWIGAFREETVKELLNVPDDWTVLALISFGYPAENPRNRQKKPFNEVVSYNLFKN
jgi:nitroreductase